MIKGRRAAPKGGQPAAWPRPAQQEEQPRVAGLESGIDFTFCSIEVAGAQPLGDGLNRTYLP